MGDAMISRPKPLPSDATVADVRDLLADDHVHMALLVDDGVLVGTVTGADLDHVRHDPAAPARSVARLAGRTTSPEAPLGPARSHMVAASLRRLAVVDRAGRLLGLLCLKRSGDGFCSDADVRSRQAALVSACTCEGWS